MNALAERTILQVTPSLEAGGVERTTIEVAEAIVRAGGCALVASLGGRLEGALRGVGGRLAPMPVHDKNPWVMAANIGRLADLAARERVALIHARSRAPAWSALLAARRRKLPFVTTYHGIYSSGNPLKRFYNSIMARGDVVIANSHYTRAHILKEHKIDPAKIVVIPRGADLDVFDPAKITPERLAAIRAQFQVRPDETRLLVLAPARMSRWKGQDLLVEAVGRMPAEDRARILFLIAGDLRGREAYVRTLRTMIAARDLDESVRLIGHVEDMPAAFMAVDFAVFPTLLPEAFGRGAVEAQAMGKPVIAADHGGLSETIAQGDTGLLIRPGEADSLANALSFFIKLAPEARARMGAAGAARARSLYSVTALQQATLAIYARLLQDRA